MGARRGWVAIVGAPLKNQKQFFHQVWAIFSPYDSLFLYVEEGLLFPYGDIFYCVWFFFSL